MEIQGSFAATNVDSPLLAEAMTLFLANDKPSISGLKNFLWLQIRNCYSKLSYSKDLYVIQQDILTIALDFEEISFSFVSRKLNCRANAIAKFALVAFTAPAFVPTFSPVHI